MNIEVFDVDALLGVEQPVFVFTIQTKRYEAFKSADLPERYQIRLLEAETEFAELNEELYSKLEQVSKDLESANKELEKITKAKKDAPTQLYLKIRRLQQQENTLNVRLVTPARHAIEAMCKLEPDALSFLPIKFTNQLYGKIMDALYKSTEEKPLDELEKAEGKAEEATETDSTDT